MAAGYEEIAVAVVKPAASEADVLWREWRSRRVVDAEPVDCSGDAGGWVREVLVVAADGVVQDEAELLVATVVSEEWSRISLSQAPRENPAWHTRVLRYS